MQVIFEGNIIHNFIQQNLMRISTLAKRKVNQDIECVHWA
jgi:hypothetical protein